MPTSFPSYRSMPNPGLAAERADYRRLVGKAERLISRDICFQALKASADWLRAATESAAGKGIAHRMATYYSDGRVEWLYPYSNTAEMIAAWLDLEELLHDSQYGKRAQQYAVAMLDDPEHGFYRGPDSEAQGLIRYWTNGGSYSGVYTMRMPQNLYRLYQATGEERFLEVCLLIGRTLLRRQTSGGLISADWSPQRKWAEGEGVAGARTVYGTAAFATLYHITNEQRYLDAYERSVEALLRMQNPDGSFYQLYLSETVEPHPENRSVKPFLYSYILNAISAAYEVIKDDRILEAAEKLGTCVAGLYYYRNAIPYCTRAMSPSDQTEANGWSADAANGLLWLAEQTGGSTYRDVGIRLWLDAWNAQIEDPGNDGWHGALIQGINPDLKETLQGVHQNRRHLFYEPGKIGKCTLWYVVNYVFSTKRMLGFC